MMPQNDSLEEEKQEPTAVDGVEPPAAEGVRLDTSSSPSSSSKASNPASRKHRARPLKWEWNLPLLGATVGAAIILPVFFYFAYYYQTSRVVDGIWSRANAAKEEGDFQSESRWLNLLVTFNKEDKEALVRLALAMNGSAKSGPQIMEAQRALTNALGALGESDSVETIRELRCLLIQRLLDLGNSWAGESERQTILLKAEPENPDALQWLALSLYSQVESGEWRSRNKVRYERSKDFWAWASYQPVGEILRLALDKNPESEDLAIALLHAYVVKKNYFDLPDNDDNRAKFDEKARSLIQQLQGKDDGRSQCASYMYAQSIDRELARRLLPDIAPMAMERLRSLPPSKNSNSDTASIVVPSNDTGKKEGDWDAQLVASYGAQLSDQGEAEKAYRQFDDLISIENGLIPNSLLESIYVGAGQALWSQGKADEAHRVWRQGCERIGPLDGLALWHTIAYHACESGRVQEGVAALDELSAAIKQASASLLNLSLVRADARSSKQLRIDAVKWYNDVLHAGLELREGRASTAVQNLTTALSAKISIIPAHRAYASKLLARAHAEMGVWDLSARALEEAIALEPENKLLRRQAADAWSRAGGASRSIEQLKLSDDGSFDLALTVLQSTLSNQKALPPSQRDNTKIRQSIEETSTRLKKEKQKGAFPPREWLFDAIRLSSDNGMNMSSSVISASEREAKFIELFKRYPSVPELQSLAAISLRGLGKQEDAALALSNLEKLKESHFQIWLETQVKLALSDNDVAKARRLVDEAIASKKIPDDAILDITSRIFESAGLLADACEFLKRKADAKSESNLFRIGSMLLDLEQQFASGKSSDSSGQANGNPSQELDDVIQRLSDVEGERGSHWRLLKSGRLLRSYKISKNEKELQSSAKLQAEILAVRPRWAPALALGGEIASAQGKPEKAVESLQKAISEGDLRVSTVYELVRQLNGLGRFTEAEFEFERIAEFSGKVGMVSELEIGIAQGKGQFERALELARQGIERRKNDASAWLFLAQAALLNIAKSPELTQALVAEADHALDEANRLSGTGDVNVWLYRFRFASQFQGIEKVRRIAEELAKSSVPERRRALLSVRAYLQLREFETAKTLLDKALAESPRDIEVKIALVEYYRLTGDQKALVDTLEELVRLDPKREDTRKALAVALVTNSQASGALPWERIATLIGDSAVGNSESARLYYAMLLATRGEETQLKTCKQLLRELVKSQSLEIANEAIRLSIAIEQKRWMQSNVQVDTAASADSFLEIRRLYDVLTKRKEPSVPDLFQYADFLLRASKTDDVPWLIDRIQALTPDSPQVLVLRLRLAREKKLLDRIPGLVESWIQSGAKSTISRASVAGGILMQLGFEELGVTFLQRAYSENPKEFRPFVVSLSRTGKMKEAIEVCIAQSQSDSESAPDAIALLADVAFQDAGLKTLADRIENVFSEGLKDLPSNPVVLESIGTLRLNQQRYPEALELLLRAEAIAPNNLMTLNNLAVATSEISGRETEGLPRITRAIELFGRYPELLDTLGVVQFRCGMLKEAQASLQEAVSRGKDPRFRLHLIQVLGARKNETEINKIAKDLNIAELRKMPLTASERLVVEEVSKKIGNESS